MLLSNKSLLVVANVSTFFKKEEDKIHFWPLQREAGEATFPSSSPPAVGCSVEPAVSTPRYSAAQCILL